MSEKITRRDCLAIMGAGVGLAGLALIPGSSSEQTRRKTPEFKIANNGVIISIINVDMLAGKETDIDTIYFHPSDDFSDIDVILDRKPNTNYSLSTIVPQTDYPKHGFVPFDPAFNIEKALEHLKEQHKTQKPELYTDEKMVDLTLMAGKLSQNDPGLSFPYEMPQLNKPYMYVLYSLGFYTVNGKIPPPVILRAKFTFMKNNQEQERSPSQPSQL